jgi:hypothetical protein
MSECSATYEVAFFDFAAETVTGHALRELSRAIGTAKAATANGNTAITTPSFTARIDPSRTNVSRNPAGRILLTRNKRCYARPAQSSSWRFYPGDRTKIDDSSSLETDDFKQPASRSTRAVQLICLEAS